ncbi:GDP-mannose transporter [Cantharellus anzutake]|uniref:GDP-mannose transporter n=1 Tax=Cantharellus anzutake TaxID=1750568 RepID=UPI0019046626|nr:GDP-mannose transporter [Cantharellus anzutake]KAF8329462.1 GDP-mannose transporter [Cantharellus anzutake]
MSSTMSIRQSSDVKYSQVPQNDTEDIVELRKAQSTAQQLSILNHPALPVLCYCLASIMMTVVNKYVVSGANFNMTCLLLAIQSTVCVVVVQFVKALGIIDFQDFDITVAKKWFPVSFMLASVIYTGSKSLQYLSIPVFTIFKNLTIILIAYGEVLWFGGKVTRLSLVSFLLMVFSSIIAAWSDIAITLENVSSAWSSVDPGSGSAPLPVSSILVTLSGGYFWMFLNCISTAAYVLTMRKRIKAMSFGDWDTMFYNNFLSIPVLTIFSFLVEDWSMVNLVKNFPPDNRQLLLSAIAFSGAAAVGISYTTAWCLRATSSTTYSMVGALNKLPIAASGMVFFGDPITLGSVSAISVGFFAGVVYAVAKNNQAKAEKARLAQSSEIPLHQAKS